MSRGPSIVAFAYPATALLIALGFQRYGYEPCHLCLIQRWPLGIAVVIASGAVASEGRMRAVLVMAAAISILTSGIVGGFHAGVEYGWWTYDGTCTAVARDGADMLRQIMSAPVVPCDRPQWTVLGVSMAGINAILSGFIGLVLPIWQIRNINQQACRGEKA